MKNHWTKQKQMFEGNFSNQYVKDEQKKPVNLEYNQITKFQLEEVINPGTMTGTVYEKGKAVLCFSFQKDGVFSIFIGVEGIEKNPEIVPIDGFIDNNSGTVTLLWNQKPKNPYIAVSYKYTKEIEPVDFKPTICQEK